MTIQLLKSIGLSILLLCFCCNIALSQAEQKMEKGHEFFKQGDYQKALGAYENAYQDYLNDGMQKEAVATLEYVAKSYMHQYKTDMAMEKYYQMASLSKEAGWHKIYKDALNSIMVIKNFRGKTDSTEIYAHMILNAKELNFRDSSDAFTILSNAKMVRMELDSAEFYINKAIAIDKMNSDSSSLPFTYSGLGTIKSKQGKTQEALDISIEATKWLRPGIDDFKKITFYRTISELFLDIKNIPKAKEYINESIEMAKEHKTINNLAYSLLQRAYIYDKEENFERALVDYQEVMVILSETKTKYSYAEALLGNCNCYLAMNQHAKCPSYLKEFSQLAPELDDDNLNLRFDLINLELSLINKTYSEAKKYIEKVKQNPNYSKSIYQIQKLERLQARYYEKIAKPELALEHFKAYQSIRDSLYTLSQSIAMSEMESKFNKKENELEIAKLEFNDHKNQTRISRQRTFLVVGGLILFCLSYLMFRIFSQKRQIEKQNKLISQSLNEKELLLKEIHHRVKNNLQIISSLLSLQGQYVDDPNVNAAIQEGRNRVKSMSLIHQNLYQKDNLAGVHVKDYMLKLFQNLFDSYNIAPNRISLVTDIDEIDLDIDTIIPLGLVINELLTNSLKYAFPDERKGEVKLTIKEEQDQLVVAVQDDGVGIEDVTKLSSNQSFGFELIEAFKHKLKADLEISGENGTKVSLKINNYKKVA